MIIRLTDVQKGTDILIGTESVIDMKQAVLTNSNAARFDCTKIQSRGAMVTTNWVAETVDEIWEMINKTK